jgi:hypothetical protein
MIVEALTRRTVELCRVASVTGNEADCAELVEAHLRDTPLAVQRIGETVLARTASRPGRPLILLVGHTDTVPPKPGDGPVRVEGDQIFGLGASDMKGGLAVMLELASVMGDGATLPYDVGFVFYDKEEGPWADSGLGPGEGQLAAARRARLLPRAQRQRGAGGLSRHTARARQLRGQGGPFGPSVAGPKRHPRRGAAPRRAWCAGAHGGGLLGPRVP